MLNTNFQEKKKSLNLKESLLETNLYSTRIGIKLKINLLNHYNFKKIRANNKDIINNFLNCLLIWLNHKFHKDHKYPLIAS